MNYFSEYFQESVKAFQDMERIAQDLELIADAMHSTLMAGGKIMWMGNGGSASDAQHLAAELVGKFELNRPPLASIALTTDTSIITATGNDYSFEKIFERQILAIGKQGDFLVGISTSGKSQNVLLGFEVARIMGIKTLFLTGSSALRNNIDATFSIFAPAVRTCHIQELHIAIGQSLCGYIEKKYFGTSATS